MQRYLGLAAPKHSANFHISNPFDLEGAESAYGSTPGVIGAIFCVFDLCVDTSQLIIERQSCEIEQGSLVFDHQLVVAFDAGGGSFVGEGEL